MEKGIDHTPFVLVLSFPRRKAHHHVTLARKRYVCWFVSIISYSYFTLINHIVYLATFQASCLSYLIRIPAEISGFSVVPFGHLPIPWFVLGVSPRNLDDPTIQMSEIV